MRSRVLTVLLVIGMAFLLVTNPVVSDAAGGLTKGAIKKISKKTADKEIAKKSSGLSVGHAGTADSAKTAASATTATSANTLAGQPPSAYQDSAAVYNFTFDGSRSQYTNLIPSTPGTTYQVSYSAYLSGNGDFGYCELFTQNPAGTDVQYYADDAGDSTNLADGYSGIAVITIPAGDQLFIQCGGQDSFSSLIDDIPQVAVTTLDSVTRVNGLAAAARPALGANSRAGH